MKLEMNSTNRVVLALVVVAALAAAFWMLLLSPKRDEAKKLGDKIETVEASLEAHRAEVAEAEQAREEFPQAYQQMVVLGKAVPGDDDTASLLVQVNRIANRSEVRFSDFSLNSEGGEEEAATATAAPETAEGAQPVSATEVEAATLPLGAAIGPAGLYVMPYSLQFQGGFFELADFIKGLDALVKTSNEQVTVNGRLLTINGFSLSTGESDFPELEGAFAVTTYLTPPATGVTAGATPSGPATETAAPAATTTGGTP